MYLSSKHKVEPQLTENALKVLQQRRYLRGETPSEMFERVANHVASAEYKYLHDCPQEDADAHVQCISTLFYNMMASLYFLPNSPTLMNAGRRLGQLSACFVVPVEDSIDGIFKAIYNMAMIQKTGGGTGFSFSRLRPVGDNVTSTVGEASGPISFMTAFNACTDVIKQGGARRGANMGILRVDHPDILEFIDCKKDLESLTNFNISVGITDEFMQCLENNESFTLKFNGVEYAKIDPNLIFEKIVQNAWASGEPGVVFLDRINEDNPVPHVGEIESTNPCGEQPLLPFESCNLGSINLALMLKPNHKSFRSLSDKVDWDKLYEVVTLAVRFLDDVIDVNVFPLPEIEEATKANRKIGLGVMGWADMLYQMHVSYDSPEAIRLAEEIMQYIQQTSHQASVRLADDRGTFPNYEGSVWHKQGIPMRNATTTTIAPTGTLAVIAGVSSGIEANFGLLYEKKLADNGGTLQVLNPYFEEYIDETQYDKQEIIDSLKTTGKLPEYLKNTAMCAIFKTAHEIAPKYHVLMQAAFQKYTDNAVSKTINFTNDVTVEDIGEAIMLAYISSCKGITVYRDGSRASQPLVKVKPIVEEKTQNEASMIEIKNIEPLKRPDRMAGVTERVKTGCGVMFVTINSHQDKIYEVFLKAGATGGCAAFTEGTARLISIALRYGVPIEEIINQLNSVRCDNFRYQTGKNPELKGKSCPDVIGRLMKTRLQELQEAAPAASAEKKSEEKPMVRLQSSTINEEICPDCGEKLSRDGCVVCTNCGYSHC